MEEKGGKGAQLKGTQIPLLLYADDIVLISDSPEEMQKHLNIKVDMYVQNALYIYVLYVVPYRKNLCVRKNTYHCKKYQSIWHFIPLVAYMSLVAKSLP